MTTDANTDTPPVARPKRMTLSEVVEHLLARGTSDRSSVTLTRNAKGETQIEVVVRTSDAAGAQTVDEAAAKACELYDSMRDRYPMLDGLTAAKDTVKPR